MRLWETRGVTSRLLLFLTLSISISFHCVTNLDEFVPLSFPVESMPDSAKLQKRSTVNSKHGNSGISTSIRNEARIDDIAASPVIAEEKLAESISREALNNVHPSSSLKNVNKTVDFIYNTIDKITTEVTESNESEINNGFGTLREEASASQLKEDPHLRIGNETNALKYLSDTSSAHTTELKEGGQGINSEHDSPRIPAANTSRIGIEPRQDRTSQRMATISKEATTEGKCHKKKCALLFFGIVQNGFQEFILPSIRRNILSINPDCDIFIHTYNLTSLPLNPRSEETTEHTIHAEDAYLLAEADHVKIQTVEDFWAKRAGVVNSTKGHFCVRWGKCCTSHINMLKQWHSINEVWDLMVESEKSILGPHNEDGHYYEQFGFFRSDTYFPTPISIYEHNAGVPDFAHWGGINDRLFYGKREYAKIWSHRFDFVEDYKRKWLEQKQCFHSESYVAAMLRDNKVPVKENGNICIWRVRSGSRVSSRDCQVGGGQGVTNVTTIKYLPVGYTAINMKGTHLTKLVRDKGARNKGMDERLRNKDLKWPSEPVIDKLRQALMEMQSESSCHKSR